MEFFKYKEIVYISVYIPRGRKSFTGKTKAICLERFKAYQTYREENGIRLLTRTTVLEYYKHF